MAARSGSSPVEPLSIGNIVSVAFQLYRENAKQYLGIALTAIGWSLLPILAAIAIVAIAAIATGATQQLASGVGLFVLAAVAILVLGAFCFAKSLASSALIVRLAFGQMSDQSLDELESRRFVNSRKWSFLLTQVLVGLITGGALVGFYLVIALLIAGVVLSVGGGGSGNSSTVGVIIFVILILITSLAAIVGFTWLAARLTGAEVPLAVESHSSATQSVSRFWQLTKGNVWRVALVLVITFGVTLPVYILAQILSVIPQGLVAALVPEGSQEFALFNALSILISYAIGLVLNVLILPLWQSVKAVLYYDLRNRQEGLDLKFRDR